MWARRAKQAVVLARPQAVENSSPFYMLRIDCHWTSNSFERDRIMYVQSVSKDFDVQW